MDLASRKQKVLAAIVENYIETGEPVGSKTLLDQMDISVSSATIRNEMADLTNSGYLLQPHTSAGRIPSQMGYRFYIDNFLKPQSLNERIREYIDTNLEAKAKDPENILNTACKIISELTDLAAVTTAPSETDSRIMRIKFVQTGRHTAMAVIVTSTGMVKNRLFRCEYILNDEILSVFEKALNEKLAGFETAQLTQPVIQTIAASFGELSLLMPGFLTAIKEAAETLANVSTTVSGQIKLLFTPGIDFDTARNLVAFLSVEENISKLFENVGTGIHSIIGRENIVPQLFNSSVVATRYEIENRPAGVLAVMGPIRMNYKTVYSILEYTAGAVSEYLSEIIRI
ncbi:MAG: heat-inducible transcription repressor HrcA [Ruminococcus sp.]|nr:heat-inducible transcription repressor HrcA [Ruminococcus sp.]